MLMLMKRLQIMAFLLKRVKIFEMFFFLDIDYTLTSDPETSDVKERRFTFYQNNVTQGTVYTKTQLFIASGETKCESLHARIAVVIYTFFLHRKQFDLERRHNNSKLYLVISQITNEFHYLISYVNFM